MVRDQRTLRAAVAERDEHAIREDSAHVIQALGRLDNRLDAVFAETRLQRLQDLRLADTATR